MFIRMILHAIFKIKSPDRYSQALEELISSGLENHYLLEDELLGIFIGGFSLHAHTSWQHLAHSELHKCEEAKIDWTEQWQCYAPEYSEGIAKISLEQYGVNSAFVELTPGPGFGDLSHSTTHLMLQLMASEVAGKKVIDLGCGSGILSIAAMKMGAKEVRAIDICEQALRHASENIALNGFEKEIHTLNYLPDLSGSIVLMNMTLWEQKFALQTYPEMLKNYPLIIVSGILDHQKEYYGTEIFPKRITQLITCNNWLGLKLQ